MACQSIGDYFRPREEGIMFIVHLYLHFLFCCFFFTYGSIKYKIFKQICLIHKGDSNRYNYFGLEWTWE